MSRIVVKTANGPLQVGDKFICQCGLSKNQPFCDASHKKTEDENKDETYLYTEESRQVVHEISVGDDGCCCCEGGGCQCGDECKCGDEKDSEKK